VYGLARVHPFEPVPIQKKGGGAGLGFFLVFHASNSHFSTPPSTDRT
jgi:hypothetical protein